MNRNILQWILGIFVLGSAASGSCLAQGDYSMSLDESYNLERCSSIETLVTSKSSTILFSPDKFDSVGPITHFCSENSHLLLKACGRKRLFNEPTKTAEVRDLSKTFFFALRKKDDSLLGPMSDAQFSVFLEQNALELPQWSRPIPLEGKLILFTGYAVAIGAVALLVWLVAKGKTRTGTKPSR